MSSVPALPLLTRAESELMRLLWGEGPATIHVLLERVEGSGVRPAPAYNTVLTLVRILEQKGYVAHQPDPQGGRGYVYRPCVDAVPVRRRHVRDLVDRLFGGKAEDLMVGLLEDERLTRGELEQLREQIERKLGKPKRRKP
jgi:BlaI family penicillinase repressor